MLIKYNKINNLNKYNRWENKHSGSALKARISSTLVLIFKGFIRAVRYY